MIAEAEILDREYTAYGGAARLFKCQALEILCESGAGTGKTFSLMQHANYTARKYPGCRLFFARDTRKSLNDSVLDEWENKVLWPGHPAITGTASKEHRDYYEYPNGSRISLIGLDNVDRIMSAQFDKGYVFEATEISLEDHEKLLSRLRNGMTDCHQLIEDCNPGSEYNWLNQRFPKAGETQPNRVRILYRHEDNPKWYDHALKRWTSQGISYIRDVLGSLTGARKERLLHHRWVSEEGQVLPEFDPRVHCITLDKVPPLTWYTAAMDFGYNAPGCLQVWGYDADDRGYRLAEVYRRGWTIDQWADAAEELRKEFPYRFMLADSARPDDIRFLNKRLHTERESDAVVRACDKSRGVLHGIDLLRDLLKPDALGKPRMYFVKDALRYGADPELRDKKRPVCTEQEIPSYVFRKNEEGREIKDEPDRACADHGIDAARYNATFAWGRDLSEHVEAPLSDVMTPEPVTMGQLLKTEDFLSKIRAQEAAARAQMMRAQIQRRRRA